jgi:hypothetical protein
MSCYVCCLYSTEDGEPRYIGRASDKVSYRYEQHITAALEKESGALYDWMRDVWRRDADSRGRPESGHAQCADECPLLGQSGPLHANLDL